MAENAENKSDELNSSNSKRLDSKLSTGLSNAVDVQVKTVVDNGRYGLSWAGKSDCFSVIQERISETLHPQLEESVDWDATQNLFIEGDNLQALKILHKAYYGKVKMIYIDPPYNTGNDFVYNDSFSTSRAKYREDAGLTDNDGNQMRSDGLTKNTRDNGHYHSNWLNMMYPRLFLARNLLREDGVIFISIDDHEVANLRLICNEIFGEENFIDTLHWKRKKQPSFLAKHTAKVMEYVLVYGKDASQVTKLSTKTISDETKK